MNHFTIVFPGNLRELNFNPFKIATSFGFATIVGEGNLIEQRNELLEALHRVEAVMSIVPPRSDRASYLAALEDVRAAIAKAEGK